MRTTRSRIMMIHSLARMKAYSWMHRDSISFLHAPCTGLQLKMPTVTWSANDQHESRRMSVYKSRLTAVNIQAIFRLVEIRRGILAFGTWKILQCSDRRDNLLAVIATGRGWRARRGLSERSRHDPGPNLPCLEGHGPFRPRR